MKLGNGWWIGILLCGLLCALSWGQIAPPGAPGAPPSPAPFASTAPPPPPRPAMDNTILPDIKFDNIPLDQALKQLEEKVPDFHSVIVNDPSVDMPVLPSFSAKNLSLGQFLDFLKAAFPGVEIQVIDGPNAPLYVFRIRFSPDVAPPPITVVKVYPLKEIVLSIAGPNASEDATKKAMDDVLSLVQSAVSALGDNGQYVMSVHKPTMTLIFRGTPRMMETADQVMTALEPKGVTADAQRKMAEQTARELVNNREYNNEIDEKQARLLEKTAQIDQLTRELTEAKYRLEMDQKYHPSTTRP